MTLVEHNFGRKPFWSKTYFGKNLLQQIRTMIKPDFAILVVPDFDRTFMFEYVYFLKRLRHFVFLYSVNFRAPCTTHYHLGSRKGDKNTIVAVAKVLFDLLHRPSGVVLLNGLSSVSWG
jgi:hypothetical protein